MNINLRKIRLQDNAVLAEIIRNCFHDFNAPTSGTVYEDPTTDNLFDLFHKEGSILWVAEENETILGCCGIYPTEGLPEKHAELVKFYLSKEARGKGVGKLLMEKSIESAKELGYRNIYLESLPAFSNAVRIYEKLNFTHLDCALGNSGHTGCNIWMVKKL